MGVVLETGGRAVRRAGAFPLKIVLGTFVFIGIVLAKSITGVLLGTTPGRSGSEIHSIGVNCHVKGALIVLDSLGRDGGDGHGEEGKR